MANHGGLSSPTEYTFAVATLGAKFYNPMLNQQSTFMQRFLKQKDHHQKLVDAVCKTNCSYDMLQFLLSMRCAQLHSNFECILRCISNCFAKNELKRFNAQLSESAPAPKTMQVILHFSAVKSQILFVLSNNNHRGIRVSFTIKSWVIPFFLLTLVMVN